MTSLDRDAASRRSIVAAIIDINKAAAPSSMSSSRLAAQHRHQLRNSGANRFPAGGFATAQHFSSAAAITSVASMPAPSPPAVNAE